MAQVSFTKAQITTSVRDWWASKWPHFGPGECSCRHCGDVTVDTEFMHAMELTRKMWGRPMVLNSVYRCPTHNKTVGGAERSYHMQGRAADVEVGHFARAEFGDLVIVDLIKCAVRAKLLGTGLYIQQAGGFIHLDNGPPRTWQQYAGGFGAHDDVMERRII